MGVAVSHREKECTEKYKREVKKEMEKQECLEESIVKEHFGKVV